MAGAAYRSGTKIFDERRGRSEDYTRKRDIEHSEVLLPQNVPDRLRDRGVLWNAIETSIKHPRGQPAMEIEAALPRELSKEQCLALCREFAADMLVERGAAVDFSIHRTRASDGGEHPHVHFLISTRMLSPDGTVGKSLRDMQDNPKLITKIYSLEEEGKIDEALKLQKGTNLGQWRKAWEDYSNRFLDENGETARIDHRTLKAQSIGRNALPNIGHAFYEPLRGLTGHLSRRVEQWKTNKFQNAMRRQMDEIKKQRPDLTAEFIAHAQEYGERLFPDLKNQDRIRGVGISQ